MKVIEESSIIICSIVRNAEKGLKKNIPVIKELCKHFRDYQIIVYENDSTDDTKTLLQKWMEEDKQHVVALLNNTDSTKTIPSSKSVNANPFFSRKRIEKMASLRNHYMEYIGEHHLSADYLMVVDLDVAQLYLRPILTSFAKDAPDWDVVTAFGYSTSPTLKRRFHDTYALIEFGKENIPQTEQAIHDLASDMVRKLNNGKWLRVFSGFGGLAIYRFDKIEGLRYQVLENKNPRVEVRCEHASLYKQMSDKGETKIYVNPKMVLKYQSVTLSLILNTIKRKIGLG